ncbi:MAG: hypothetical protein KKF46_03880, partial [Nanoarchaeota archaeon]|nr:hypothetical protein [Nanoarchaeota archaeon]MBU1597385.1 hypothetical protein [Nanoarchaeota archaeon]MBU2442282.1 hypothetical protein [Nanoarchaeota archaeon]
MDRKALFMFSIFFVSGMFLLGEGITGLYVMDFQQPACDADDKCIESNVCCLFYNEDFGVCDNENNCDAIEKATFDARRKISTYDSLDTSQKYSLFSTVTSHIEGPKKENRLYSMIAGVILIFIALAGLFIGKVRDIHA